MLTESIIIGVTLTVVGVIWRVNNKIKNLKSFTEVMYAGQTQVKDTINSIGNLLGSLQNIVSHNNESLSKNIPNAQNISSEFEILIKHSEGILQRLDKVLNQAYDVERKLKGILQNIEKQVNTPKPHIVLSPNNNSNQDLGDDEKIVITDPILPLIKNNGINDSVKSKLMGIR